MGDSNAPGLGDDAERTTNWGHANSLLFWTLSFLMMILCGVHTVKVYQDLHTKERKSVAHRRTKPAVDSKYKLTQRLTLVSVYLNLGWPAMQCFANFLSTGAACDISWTIILIFVQLSKTTMHLVFLVRLYSIYEKSVYRYPLKCVRSFAAVLIVTSILICTGYGVFVQATAHLYENEVSWPNWCSAATNTAIIVVGFVVVQDIAVAVGFLCGFMIPLKKTLKLITESNNASAKIQRKIAYAGTKTMILTLVSTFTTIIFILAVGATGLALFAAPDAPVNAICLMLMTPYYKDSKWYETLCSVCITCCDKNPTQTENELEDNLEVRTGQESTQHSARTSSIPVSVDTASALRVTAAKVTQNYNDDNSGNPIPEVTPEPAALQ